MNKKIIGILICILLIATAVPAVESLKNTTIKATVLSNPLTSMATNLIEMQKLLTTDDAVDDNFGVYTSLDGDTALIGAASDDDNGANSGSAYVFTKSGVNLTYSITGGLGVHLEITNHLPTDVKDVPWWIHVKGGYIQFYLNPIYLLGRINKTMNGTIDIPAGETRIVGTGMLFGLGYIYIEAKIDSWAVRTATGTQLIIFSAFIHDW